MRSASRCSSRASRAVDGRFPAATWWTSTTPAGDALRAGKVVYFPGFLYGPPWAVAFAAVSWLGPAPVHATILVLDVVALWTIAWGNWRRLGYILWFPLIPFEIAAGQLNLVIAAAIVAAQRGLRVAARCRVAGEGVACHRLAATLLAPVPCRRRSDSPRVASVAPTVAAMGGRAHRHVLASARSRDSHPWIPRACVAVVLL